MKGKRFYLILIGLIMVGVGSIFIYRQQQEAKTLEFEGYEISSIEKRVDELYVRDKTDIKKGISGELADLDLVFLELTDKDLSYRSKKRVKNMEEEFLTATGMFELQEVILDLFVEDKIVKNNISPDTIEELEISLLHYEDKTTYFKRNKPYITDARTQLGTIEEATKLVEGFSTNDIPHEDVELEDLDKATELVNQIKDEEILKKLMEQIEFVRLALEEAENEEKIVEGVDEQEDLEEEQLVETSTDIEELDDEEIIENSNEEIVPENNQRVKQSEKSIVQNNKQSSQTIKNNQQSSSQSQKQSSDKSSSQSNNRSNSSTNNQSTPTEKKSEKDRNSVKEIYQETKEEPIPYKTVTTENNLFEVGTEIIFTDGEPGKRTVVYEVIEYQNGTSNRKVLSEEIVEPTPLEITIGTKDSSSDDQSSENQDLEE